MLRTIPSPNDKHQTFKLWSDPAFDITGELFETHLLFLHLDIHFTKLTPSVYKRGLLACATIKDAAAERGIPNLYVMVPEHLMKWEQMLGFSDYILLVDNRTGERAHIMIQPTKDSS